MAHLPPYSWLVNLHFPQAEAGILRPLAATEQRGLALSLPSSTCPSQVEPDSRSRFARQQNAAGVAGRETKSWASSEFTGTQTSPLPSRGIVLVGRIQVTPKPRSPILRERGVCVCGGEVNEPPSPHCAPSTMPEGYVHVPVYKTLCLCTRRAG